MGTKAALSVDRAKGILIRRMGLFSKTLLLADITEIWAINRDALTFDEVSVHLLKASGEDFSMKEYESGFEDVIRELAVLFPGIETWAHVGVGAPLAFRKQKLWP